VAGITLATGAQHSFTAETFEHVALAAGCQLVDGAGAATLNSTRCRAAFRLYVDLARSSSPRGVQNVESTRDAYFAGRGDDLLVAVSARRHGGPAGRRRAAAIAGTTSPEQAARQAQQAVQQFATAAR
jgi:hypothetical protein